MEKILLFPRSWNKQEGPWTAEDQDRVWRGHHTSQVERGGADMGRCAAGQQPLVGAIHDGLSSY